MWSQSLLSAAVLLVLPNPGLSSPHLYLASKYPHQPKLVDYRIGMYPPTRTFGECILNYDCSTDKACINRKCQDPCSGLCGVDASCNVTNHQPMCSPTSSVDVKETEENKEERVHYDGYQVIRALPDSQDQLDSLKTIGE